MNTSKPRNSRHIRPATEGQRLLLERRESGAHIAESVGASRASVSCWRSGRDLPGQVNRERLEALFGIRAGSWGEPPTTSSQTPASDEPEPDVPRAVPTAVSELRELAERAGMMCADASLTAATRQRWGMLQARCLSDLARRYDLSPDEVVATPAFTEVKGWIVEALGDFPEARDAVIAALSPQPQPTAAPEASLL